MEEKTVRIVIVNPEEQMRRERVRRSWLLERVFVVLYLAGACFMLALLESTSALLWWTFVWCIVYMLVALCDSCASRTTEESYRARLRQRYGWGPV